MGFHGSVMRFRGYPTVWLPHGNPMAVAVQAVLWAFTELLWHRYAR